MFPESVSRMTKNNSLPINLYIEAKPKGKEELLFLTHLLYQARICLKFANNKGQYPLHIACQCCGDWNVIWLLLILDQKPSINWHRWQPSYTLCIKTWSKDAYKHYQSNGADLPINDNSTYQKQSRNSRIFTYVLCLTWSQQFDDLCFGWMLSIMPTNADRSQREIAPASSLHIHKIKNHFIFHQKICRSSSHMP